jgi:hypothetical protein
MRILFLLFTLLPMPFSVNAQSPNFFADGSRWVYHTWQNSEPGQETVFDIDEQYIIHGDTIIDSLLYAKLYTTIHHTLLVLSPPPHDYIYHTYDSSGPTFLRYDTLLKKVFYLPGIDSTERLIYDFNLQVGDTLPMKSTEDRFVTIDSIDTISLFGTQVKRFIPGSDWYWDPAFNYILEGMGGSNGLYYFRPQYASLSGGTEHTWLVCFQYGDQVYSQQGECPFIDFVSAVRPVVAQPQLSVGPNPTHGEFLISIGYELLNATFILTDYSGRVVNSFSLNELTNTSQVHLPGLYFWRIEQGGNLVSTGKLVVQ